MSNQIDAVTDRIEALEAELAIYKGRKERFAIFTDEDVSYVIECNKRISLEEQSARDGLNRQTKINKGLEARIATLEADNAELRKRCAEKDTALAIATKQIDVIEAKHRETLKTIGGASA